MSATVLSPTEIKTSSWSERGTYVRRATKRTVGVVAIAGLLLGVGITTAGLSGASGSPVVPTTTPCTTASYALTVNVTPPTKTAWSISVTGQVNFTTDAATANLTLPSSFPIAALAGTTLQAELVGATAYIAVPPALSAFVGGASWVSVALPSKLGTSLNGVFSHLAAWCGNAQSIVIGLGAHKGSTTSLGSSSINNVSANGTQVEQVGKRVSRALKLPPSISKKAGGVFGNGKLPIDVWANPQGQLVRLSITGSIGSVTLDVTNIDQPVSITPPSGAVPLSPSLLKMIGSLLGGLTL
jgi:hypothetical protein